jgi:hypothetical protein
MGRSCRTRERETRKVTRNSIRRLGFSEGDSYFFIHQGNIIWTFVNRVADRRAPKKIAGAANQDAEEEDEEEAGGAQPKFLDMSD